MFQLAVHPEARPWVPKKPYLDQITSFFTSGNISLWPRHMAESVIGRPTKPYEFRAFSRGKDGHIFVDETETPQSIAWLMAHELCHQMVDDSPTLTAAFEDARPLDMKPASDAFHFVDSEERFCDGIATRLLGYRKDRAWWRERVASRLSAR